jgi:hypothetical protein
MGLIATRSPKGSTSQQTPRISLSTSDHARADDTENTCSATAPTRLPQEKGEQSRAVVVQEACTDSPPISLASCQAEERGEPSSLYSFQVPAEHLISTINLAQSNLIQSNLIAIASLSAGLRRGCVWGVTLWGGPDHINHARDKLFVQLGTFLDNLLDE